MYEKYRWLSVTEKGIFLFISSDKYLDFTITNNKKNHFN